MADKPEAISEQYYTYGQDIAEYALDTSDKLASTPAH